MTRGSKKLCTDAGEKRIDDTRVEKIYTDTMPRGSKKLCTDAREKRDWWHEGRKDIYRHDDTRVEKTMLRREGKKGFMTRGSKWYIQTYVQPNMIQYVSNVQIFIRYSHASIHGRTTHWIIDIDCRLICMPPGTFIAKRVFISCRSIGCQMINIDACTASSQDMYLL